MRRPLGPHGPARLRCAYRSALYGYAYSAPNPIGIDDLATLDPFGLLFGNNPFNESLRIYGVRTNEGRWAAVQAVEVTFDFIPAPVHYVGEAARHRRDRRRLPLPVIHVRRFR